jgi:hypothetical protein
VADEFVCSICGKEHAGLPTDWAYTLPDDVWDIPEPERDERARYNKDLCQFGERCFIRCVLEVPFTDADGFFGWGAWAEVDWDVFQRYLELYEEDGWSEPQHSGTLANSLLPYGQTTGMPVLIQFREATQRPSLHLLPTDSSELAVEQRQGMSQQRYHDILQRLTGDD